MALTGADESTARWFAIWTQSHCEQIVHDQLVGKGLNAYLPMLRTWSRRAGTKRVISVPMFPGYLFVHCVMDKYRYIDVLSSRGVVRLLGERWDRLTPVPDGEIESLRRIAGADVAAMPHPHLREGQRVRIADGPLAGLEGILVRTRPSRGLLVLSVDLLRQSVAVEVDCTSVTPVAPPPVAADPALQYL